MIGKNTVIIENMPDAVKSFILQKQQLQSDIQATSNEKVYAYAIVNDPNDPDPGFTSSLAAQSELESAKQAHREKLENMRSDLDKMELDSIENTTIKARFTGQSYADIPIWQCVQN